MRPVVWFAAASMATTIVHELTHAVVAYALGVRSTLYGYLVDVDFTQAQATIRNRALIGISGPLVCLAAGALCLLAFKRARGSAASLPLIFLTVFGIGSFFGNLMSASFVGDFAAVAVVLGLPTGVRYVISAIGLLGVTGIHFWGGRELSRWIPAAVGTALGTAGIVALPAVAGTLAVILANQPMPGPSVVARLAEASFWLFAVLGAVTAPRVPDRAPTPLVMRWADVAAIIVAVGVVRVMVRGIPFTP